MKHLFLFLCLHCTTVLLAQVVNIEDQRIKGTQDSVRWYGHLRGSGALSKVQEKSLQFSADAKVQYKYKPNMVLLLLNVNFLSAGNSDFARQAFAHLRYNYKLSETWTWEAFTQIQTSPLQLLEQRNLVGSGARFRLLKSRDGRQRIYLGAAWLWENNRFSEGQGQNSWNRSSNYLTTTFRPNPSLVLVQTTYWQPVIGYIRNYRLSSEWALNIRLGKHIAYTLEFAYSVDKNLPPGGAAETYSWRNGLTFDL